MKAQESGKTCNADPAAVRRQLVKNCKRVVIKAGTRLLVDAAALARLVEQIKTVRESGIQVILVSSGAVGTGMKSLGLQKRPKHLSEVQALAAIGQIHLMALYDSECRKHGFQASQILLTAEDLRSRGRHLNALNCIESLLAMDILPIINENDPVSVAELKFGDNDMLAAQVASMTRSDLAIILTTVDGLKRPLPDGTLGDRIPVVHGVTDDIRGMARGTDDSSMSIGGMASKLKCADILNSAGECLWIADGRDASIIQQIFNGEDVGTVFLPDHGKIESKKRWLSSFAKSVGTVYVDDGAARALQKKGSSLLPSGITRVSGTFQRGSVVEVVNGKTCIARGLSNFSAAECRKLAGCQTTSIHDILKCDAESEVIHRNNMVVF
jgi:glutamate 5-kinase